MVKHLEKEDNLKELKNGKKVIVDYFATWCMPCKMIAPILEEVAEEDKEITIVKVDIDDFEQEAMMDGIRSVPTLIFYKEGKEVKRVSGVHTKEEILDIMNKYNRQIQQDRQIKIQREKKIIL